jgi:hypothetical protein
VVNKWQGEKMNQPTFVPSILNIRASEEVEKSVAKDMENHEEKSISELLNEKEVTQDETQETERHK